MLDLPPAYELHVTVKANDITKFRQHCEELGVKPIVLELQNRTDGETVMLDVMTTSRYPHFPIKETKDLTGELFLLDYEVVRVKIEAAPWCLDVPSATNGIPVLPMCYFEGHIRVRTTEERLPDLRLMCKALDVHVSRNIFKKVEGGVINMVTIRRGRGDVEWFQDLVTKLSQAFDFQGFKVDKMEVEYVLYDSNKMHDLAWVNA